MEWNYIDQLNQAYDSFFIENQARNEPGTVTVLTLDTNELDYIRRVEDLKWVENRI